MATANHYADVEESFITGEVASALYAGAREEAVERIRLRDNALTLFLTAASAIFAGFVGLVTALGGDTNNALRYGSYVLLLIPVLANAAASVISQHHVLIGAIEAYLVKEFDPAIKSLNVHIPQWDRSEPVLRLKGYSILSRSHGHQLLIFQLALASTLIFLVLQLIFGPILSLLHLRTMVAMFVADFGSHSLNGRDFEFIRNERNLMLLEAAMAAACFFISLSLSVAARQTITRATQIRTQFLDEIKEAIARSY